MNVTTATGANGHRYLVDLATVRDRNGVAVVDVRRWIKSSGQYAASGTPVALTALTMDAAV